MRFEAFRNALTASRARSALLLNIKRVEHCPARPDPSIRRRARETIGPCPGRHNKLVQIRFSIIEKSSLIFHERARALLAGIHRTASAAFFPMIFIAQSARRAARGGCPSAPEAPADPSFRSSTDIPEFAPAIRPTRTWGSVRACREQARTDPQGCGKCPLAPGAPADPAFGPSMDIPEFAPAIRPTRCGECPLAPGAPEDPAFGPSMAMPAIAPALQAFRPSMDIKKRGLPKEASEGLSVAAHHGIVMAAPLLS
jgi:hypothetical protein